MQKFFSTSAKKVMQSLTSQTSANVSYAHRCVFLRHGESEWNKSNRFTGWTDVYLTETGKSEAASAGKILKEKGFKFDIAYTSVLTRAIQTYNLAADNLGCLYLPVIRSWRLNERHYGGLQGLNKSETAAKHGEAQVKIWRRSYDIPPPPLEESDERHPKNDPRYQNLPKDVLPATECLKDTVVRVLPFWYDHIATAMLEGKSPFVVAHGNSLRAIVKHLDKISDDDIVELNIPTGIPLVYEFDKDLQPIRHYYLADEADLEKKMASVAAQGKAK
jgi:2,3-bisphosphoglycerate-dependent phosphoglycerate mutase